MGDLDSFSKRIRILGKRVEENSDALVRKVAVAIDTTVVLATPVDTGRARSNWQVGIGAAPTGTLDSYGAGSSANVAIANGKRVIQQYNERHAGKYIHITNNLPYIVPLNNGHSAQAPAGYVEKAVVVGVATVQGAGSLLSENIGDHYNG